MRKIQDKFSLFWDFRTRGGSEGKLHPHIPIVRQLQGDFAAATRTSQKSIFNRDGIIQQIDTNQPPLTFNQDRGIWGIKPESQRQNRIFRSSTLENQNFYSDAEISQDDESWILTATGTRSGVTFAGNNFAGDSTTPRLRYVIIKYLNHRYVRLRRARSDSSGTWGSVAFDLITNTFTGSIGIPPDDFGFIPLTDNKILIWTYESQSDNRLTPNTISLSLTSDTSETSGAVVGGAVRFYHAQFTENENYPSSPIITNGTAVTRSPDNISITAPDKIGQQEGFIYAEVDIQNLLGNVARNIINISTGSGTNRIDLSFTSINSNEVRLFVTTGGTAKPSLAVKTITTTGRYKFVIIYGSFGYKSFVNGELTDSSDSDISDLLASVVGIGSRPFSSAPFNDTIYRIGIGKEALTDEEAIALTS